MSTEAFPNSPTFNTKNTGGLSKQDSEGGGARPNLFECVIKFPDTCSHA